MTARNNSRDESTEAQWISKRRPLRPSTYAIFPYATQYANIIGLATYSVVAWPSRNCLFNIAPVTGALLNLLEFVLNKCYGYQRNCSADCPL